MNSALLGHYALTLYRTLSRQRLYAALNVLGLAVGIAVFLLLMLDVRFETSFERWIPDGRQIYLVRTFTTLAGVPVDVSRQTLAGALDELRGDYPDLVGTRIWDQAANVRADGRTTAERVAIVDPGFFSVFDLPLVAGDKASLLKSPDDVVLTQAMARRFFGPANPLGKPLTIALQGDVRTYRVAGVLRDPPRNTDLSLGLLIPLTPQMEARESAWRVWGNVNLETYLRLATPAAAHALDADLDRFIDRHASASPFWPPPAHKALRLRTQPLVSLHLLDPKAAAVVAALGAVGVLSLLLAGVNYVNLATARAGLRAREVAVRKTMGATRRVLAAQFVAEAVATAALAALVGLAVCEMALPLVDAATGLAPRIVYLGGGSVVPLLLAVVAAIGFGAGAYPALVLSRFQPAAVLAAARSPGGGPAAVRVRQALVVLQFAIAIAFTIAIGVVASQTRYLRRADLGFTRDGLIVVGAFRNAEVSDAQRAGMIERWRALPRVVDVSAADAAPGARDDENWDSRIRRPGSAGDQLTASVVTVRPAFFETYGARLIAGRVLDAAHGGDDAPSPARNIVLDAAAARRLGFRDPREAVGKPLLAGQNPLMVVGVIDTVRFHSPHTPARPTYYRLKTASFEGEVAAVRYAGADPRVVMARLAAAWRDGVPDVPFQAATAEDNLQTYYKSDDRLGGLFSLGASLSVAIGCVGLYGLASFTTARRVREIGIRKTLGASTADVLRLLVGQFLQPVLLANLIAWPLAWLAMRQWLAGFDQRIILGLGYFLAATALTLVIALATVASQAFAVARAEPAKALRHE
jgi:putative ABC transport system permease protein